MSDKTMFPKISASVSKIYFLQNIEMTESEIDGFIRIPQESIDFYSEILECRSKDKVKSLKCIMNKLTQSKCRFEYNEFIKCSNKIKNKSVSQDACLKQDHNLSFCLDELVYPIINSISRLPTII